MIPSSYGDRPSSISLQFRCPTQHFFCSRDPQHLIPLPFLTGRLNTARRRRSDNAETQCFREWLRCAPDILQRGAIRPSAPPDAYLIGATFRGKSLTLSAHAHVPPPVRLPSHHRQGLNARKDASALSLAHGGAITSWVRQRRVFTSFPDNLMLTGTKLEDSVSASVCRT